MATSPFTILVDTREQRPWTFSKIPGYKGQGTLTVPCEWRSLGNGYGDYTILGAEHSCPVTKWRISIERKSPGDLFSTILTRRQQFLTELVNLSNMEYAAVVVEANLSTVMSYFPPYWKKQNIPKDSQLNKQRQVLASIQAWQLRYPTVRWWFLPRKYAQVWVYRLLDRFYRECMGGKLIESSSISGVRRILI